LIFEKCIAVEEQNVDTTDLVETSNDPTDPVASPVLRCEAKVLEWYFGFLFEMLVQIFRFLALLFLSFVEIEDFLNFFIYSMWFVNFLHKYSKSQIIFLLSQNNGCVIFENCQH